MIKCLLRKIPEYTFFQGKSKRLKYGRYHQSTFQFERTKESECVVGVYIDIEDTNQLTNKKEEDIIKECLDYFNQPIIVGKKRKKKTTYKYGFLKSLQYKFKKDKEDKTYIEALLITDDYQNKNFWGEALTYCSSTQEKRGRPRKKRRKK